jgi:hypothetical protein
MSVTDRPYPRFVVHLCLSALFLAFPLALTAQTVPPALESPAAQPPRTGPHGEKTTLTSTPATSKSSTVRALADGMRTPPSGASKMA